MQSKQKCKLPPGAGKCPEAVTEQRAGYETADALRTKVAFGSAATNVTRKPRDTLFFGLSTTDFSPQTKRPEDDSERSREIAPAFLAPQPLIEVRSAKAPAPSDTARIDLPKAGHFLQRVWMNAKKSGGFDRVEQRFEFGKRNSGLIVSLI